MLAGRDDIREGFVRQRRALIAVSLLLLFMDIAQLRITKLNLLGNEVLLGQPDAIYLAMWVAFFYWLARYYQYFQDLGDKGFMKAHNIRLNQLVPQAALKQALKEQPALLITPPDIKGKTEVMIEKADVWAEGTHWKVQLTVRQLTIQGEASTEDYFEAEEVTVKGLSLLLLKGRAWIHVAIHTRLFTEYLLPFVIALLPIVYGLYNLSTGRAGI